MKSLLLLAVTLISFTSLSSLAFAYIGDISINSADLKFSSTNFIEGKTVRIYATVKNTSTQDLLGVVRFFDNNVQISADQAISIFAGSTDDIFVDWTPGFGSHRVAAKIFPWDADIDDPSNNWVVTDVYAVQDTDFDGTPNASDPDDDGDNVEDEKDAFPLNKNEQFDTDGDSKGNNTDDDDDNDGVPDKSDDLPLDPEETIDTDKDGIGNITDKDDDGDEIPDTDEENTGTNPMNPDSDGDGVEDNEDAFPLDPIEQMDTDKDLIGNNIDIDDDNDGIPDEKDEFPLNKGPVIKLTDEDFTVDLFEEYTFDATPSYDDDGNIVSFEWEVDGEKVHEGNFLKQIFEKLGKHRVKLTVVDDAGESISSEFSINVLNLSLYKQLAAVLLAIALALLLYFKYIRSHNES